MNPGQQTTLGEYTVRMDDLRVTEDNQKQMMTGLLHRCSEDGKEMAKMYPARWFFNKHEEPTTEVAIRRMFGEDFYLNMPSFQVEAKSRPASRSPINPLVNWIWLGFAVMAIGTGIVLAAGTHVRIRDGQVPGAGSGDDGDGAHVDAQPRGARCSLSPPENVPIVPKDPLEQRLHSEIVCTCGCRRALDNCGMPNCGGHAAQSEKIQALMAEGKGHDEHHRDVHPRLRRSGHSHRAER